MNCQKSYRRLLNFIISIVILFSGLYFNQTEADAFFDAANPTDQSTVSGVELPISANTQINTSELLLASRTSYIKHLSGLSQHCQIHGSFLPPAMLSFQNRFCRKQLSVNRRSYAISMHRMEKNPTIFQFNQD